jgi:hypothetical protein
MSTQVELVSPDKEIIWLVRMPIEVAFVSTRGCCGRARAGPVTFVFVLIWVMVSCWLLSS